MAHIRPKRENWGTRLGVILAVMGSAVGLGNFLRFPGYAALHEGGAFMIPYFIGLLLLGLPIAWAEWTMGRYGGRKGHNSPPGIFRAIWKSPLAPYVGALSAFVPIIIYMYYIHVEAWCLGYAWYYATGQMGDQLAAAEGGDTPAPVKVLSDFVGMDGHGALFDNPWVKALPFLLISFLFNFTLIYRGVNKGIEWFAKIAMPALILCAILILVRVLTLGFTDDVTHGQVAEGLGFMWNPNWASLTNMQMWIDATGQIFFSLSVGFGLIVTYASYVRKDDDIALSATTSAAGNEFCEIALAGMIIVPAAFIFIGPAALQAAEGSSLQLGFFALPNVFAKMPAGQLFGFLFFALLFLAAVTSSLSMLQPSIALLEEGLGLGRKASVTLLGFITVVGVAFIGFFSEGLGVLDHTDFWVGNFMLYALATIMVLLFGWVMGVRKGKEELDRGAEIRIPGFVMILIKYISPVYLIGLMVLWVWQEAITPKGQGKPSRIEQLIEEPRAQMAVGLIVVVGILFMMLVNRSVARWKRIERQQTEVSP
jgi:SNF family Na+-dependent transporter